MKKLIYPFVTASLLILILSTCYYDNEEELYPSLKSTCDTLDVTFSGSIIPLLNNNCYSCHSDANANFGGGIHLQSITDVRIYSDRIKAAISNTGRFPMPPSGKLGPCSLAMFNIWFRNGMPGN